MEVSCLEQASKRSEQGVCAALIGFSRDWRKRGVFVLRDCGSYVGEEVESAMHLR